MNLKLAISTCPNDTFMFYHLLNRADRTLGIEFETTFTDVDELNKMAALALPDVTKLSFFAYAEVWDKYKLLTSGSALGKNNGPLLISKRKIYPDEVNSLHIAIPGQGTTANLLLDLAFPGVKRKTAYVFSDIEEAILSDEVDAGVIIHETRFTYQKKGLKKIADLGELWETKYNVPLPLGGIAIRRSLPIQVQRLVNQALKQSIAFAMSNTKDTYPFVKQYAQSLDDDVIYQHIKLYVNEFSLQLGEIGTKAINLLFQKAIEKGLITKTMPADFLIDT